ncbi:MAG: phosphoribosylanthranilate isomerase [Devosiaceae bacterium]|nr:phosphoribosylanthranilate isomerase [Devosiaceae bacterium MH13]
MVTTGVKICGLSEPNTLDVALSAGADMIGLVSFPKSPRHVDLETMATLATQARGRADLVILTVNATDEALLALNDAIEPDWFQLHGSEDARRIAEVRALTGKRVLKAVGIGKAEDVALANELATVADQVLLDAKPPKDATRPGGLGAVFDWSLLDALDRTKPFMLSGGLTPETVSAAIVATGADAVDVSSGVERAPGIKDADAIAAFIKAAKTTTRGPAGSGAAQTLSGGRQTA